MKKFLVTAVLLGASALAHADSWFQFEAGIGAAKSTDMGDGTWYQQGVNHKENLNSPAFLAGFTGELYAHGNWSVRYHADYVYFGKLSASCACVGDPQYDLVAHQVFAKDANAPRVPFNGQGHTQGVPVTLDLGYAWNRWRFAVEGGVWAYWATWHETVWNAGDNAYGSLSHKTSVQFGYVGGARVERGNLSLSYRYYQSKPLWRPTPGLVSGTHMLMVSYRF